MTPQMDPSSAGGIGGVQDRSSNPWKTAAKYSVLTVSQRTGSLQHSCLCTHTPIRSRPTHTRARDKKAGKIVLELRVLRYKYSVNSRLCGGSYCPTAMMIL